MLLVKYFATWVENALVGSSAYTQVGTPRLSPPLGHRSRTVPATDTNRSRSLG
jgi:hypothetical protein